jgi:hypothetical protein
MLYEILIERLKFDQALEKPWNLGGVRRKHALK